MFYHLPTEPKIADLLANHGIVISAGQIARILRQAQEPLQEEKKAIVEAGLGSTPWQHIDDTGTRVEGKNYHCHGLCNPFYTAYTTTPRKDRMTVIDVLRNQRERIFRFNAEAYEWLRQWGVSQRVQPAVQQLPAHQDWSAAELQERLAERIPNLGPGVREQILEAAAIAAYHAQAEPPVPRLLVCDDAKQFKRVTAELALCWIHNGRHYKSLEPCVGYHRQLLEAFQKKYWEYYRALRAYQRAPAPERALELRQQFDQLFSTVTGYAALDQRIAKSQAQKESLLKVLEHPEIPLHNNAAELAARWRVRKRVVSYGPRSQAGAQAWDTMETLLGTAKKLGVNFFHYIRDRVRGTKQMTSLAERIAERAKTLDRSSFLESRGAPRCTNTIAAPS
jgi:Transposase IS66 family